MPAAGKPTFDIGDDEMEMGVGIHGEPGRRRVKLEAGRRHRRGDGARAIAGDLGARRSGDALLFVNGFGGTPAMELYLMYNTARRLFEKHGVTVVRSLVGNYVTSLDMAGCSLTLVDARRRDGEALGCAGAYGRAAVGDVGAATRLKGRFRRRPLIPAARSRRDRP